ncbi:polypeptide N-acetylgalactosaminyltransferase 5 [Stegostoma tigrinum]|uniref:polypeptide N-acetylgalactosaminyltransferase 5 n=1 Tax=Stegostoma tigrinum TaxID=3053191 RepID=UPI00202B7FA9|nr:polypeptide N-acetylgalactosaminyltransferase 5 [Stegostoma tigrinum]
MVNKMRKLFRGSGRILAIIFAASIIWLIFDMAALRFSFTEINSRVSREELVRLERLRAKVLQDQELHKMFRKRAGGVYGLAEEGDSGRRARHGNRSVPAEDLAAEAAERLPAAGGRQIEGKRAKHFVRLGTRPPTNGRALSVPPRTFWNRPTAPQSRHRGDHGRLHTPAWRPRPVLATSHPASLPGKVSDVRRPDLSKPFQHPPTGAKVMVQPVSPAGQKSQFQPDQRGRSAKGSRQQSVKPAEEKPDSDRTVEATPGSPLHPHPLPTEAAENAESTALEEKLKVNLSAVAIEPNTVAIPVNDTVKQSNGKTAPTFKVWNGTKNESATINGIKGLVLKQAEFKTVVSGLLTNATNTQTELEINETAMNNLIKNQTYAIEESDFSKDITMEATLKINETNELQSDSNILNHSFTHLDSVVGVHKVLGIDITISPRDSKAVGQFGHRAIVPKEHEKLAKEKWNEGHFNVYLSDKIPLDRAIPDTRPEGCSNQVVHNNLPTTSIIMCFVDEVWSTLLRSVHSIFNRSPAHLIKEVILVDDFSTKEYLKENLDKYMSQFPKVHVIHLHERHGLIRARLVGAAVATGDVLTFLDSHVECNVGWLEPLLERIYLKRTKVACPVIEIINDEDMSYVGVSSFLRGVFTWPMNFEWKAIPDEVIKKYNLKEMDPIRCPIMAGGLFSIDKKYFYELGTYDAGLEVWGGENMELSFKVWMCGGEIEIIPCSRVGHIFRDGNPYTFPKNRIKTVERNLARVAEVWLDEYVDVFYGHGYHHLLNTNNIEFNIGNLRKQKQLRKKLQCKSFKWYLENVYPDFRPSLVRSDGLLFNVGTRRCLAVGNGTFSFELCDISKKNQHFSHSWLRLIKQMDMCIAVLDVKQVLGMKPCDKKNNNLRWLHRSFTDESTLMDHILWETSQFPVCLEGNPFGNILTINSCNPVNSYQKWKFTNYYED